MELWLLPDSTWQLIFRKSNNLWQTTVLIEDDSVAKSIPELNFHYCRSKCCRVGASNRFECAKGAHAAASDKVNIRTFKSGVCTSGICVNMEHKKWRFDWKIVNKLA
jgi:hypothetical protein